MSFMKVTDDIYIQYIYTKDAKFHKRTTKSIIRLRGFFCLCVGGFNCAFVMSLLFLISPFGASERLFLLLWQFLGIFTNISFSRTC